jgi:hypothetical protein
MLPTAAGCARKFLGEFLARNFQDQIRLSPDATARALAGLQLALFDFKDKLNARFFIIYGQIKKEQ